jgi:hypothetical protein
MTASSPSYPIIKSVYDKGWAFNGIIVSKDIYYGEKLGLNYFENDKSLIGSLFWAKYSYLVMEKMFGD